MITEALQRWIDDIIDTGRQQWALRLVAVVTAVGAIMTATAANGRWWPLGLVVVTGLAVTSAVRPDSHTSLAVITIAVWNWQATVDRVDTAWLPVAGVCLLVHHAVIALSATIPVGGWIPATVLRRWAGRTSVCAGLVGLVWVLTVAMDRRDAPGNGALTAVALVVVATAAVVIRSRSVDRPPAG